MSNGFGLTVLTAARMLADDVDALLRIPSHPATLDEQLRGAAESVAANIAEGFGRGEGRERLQFLRYARASAEETDERVYTSFRAQRIPATVRWRIHHRCVVIVRMLDRLMVTQRTRSHRP